jgi:hypothetical protein
VSKVKKAGRVAGVRNRKRKGGSAKKTGSTKAPPAVRVDIKELDPYRKCGPGTSVKFLYRVIERSDGGSASHLVYFDRHGWYCEHGRTCPAVEHARKHKRSA